MTAAKSGAGAPHVVVVPLPAQGHINPMMPIAHFLAASGITVTFVHTTRSHSLLASAYPDAPSASDHDDQSTGRHTPNSGHGGGRSERRSSLRMEVIEDGLPSDCKLKNLTLEMIRTTITPVMHKGLEELLQKLMMEQPAATEEEALPPPCCLILDSFLSWGLDVALRFGLPRVVLWTCSATVFSMGLHVPELIAKGYIPPAPPTQQGNLADKLIDFIPGVPPFRVWDIPESLRAADGLQSIAFKFFRSVFELSIKGADRILANTVYELESTVMDALTLMEQADLSCIQPVGPLCMLSSSASSMPNSTGTAHDQPASLLREDNSCLSWLDQQPESSVLYISFGSLVSVEDDVFTEIGYGLEASGERFLWVIRPDAVAGKGSVEELLPEGFMKRTCERGKVISWAPQLAVLGHPSVGAFLTHCGWNSVLESLSKGVPMLGFPNLGDQPTNLKCIVQDWKVGLPLVEPCAGGKVERGDVQGAVSGMMRGEAGRRVRGRAREWKHRIAHNALANATSHLQKLVDDLQNGRLKGPKKHDFKQNGLDFKQNGHLECL